MLHPGPFPTRQHEAQQVHRKGNPEDIYGRLGNFREDEGNHHPTLKSPITETQNNAEPHLE